MDRRRIIKRVLLATVAVLALVTSATAVYATPAPQPSVDPRTDTAYKQAYVPCGYTYTNTTTGERTLVNPCDFPDLLELGRRLITGWIMAAVIIGTMGFAYAGYLYITAMGSEEKIKHAHSIFYKVVMGIVFMLSAWLIVKVFENTFLTPEQQERSFLKG